MAEDNYKRIIDTFLANEIDVNKFIDQFMNQWRKDRDENVKNDNRFQRLIDRIFTSCDCYNEKPEKHFEIDENKLKQEVELLRHIWFG